MTSTAYARVVIDLDVPGAEISRHLYMNEVTLEKTDNFGAVRQIVERLVSALIGLDLGALQSTTPVDAKLAAE